MRKIVIAAAATAVLGAGVAHAEPITEAIVGQELPKCVNGVGVPGGCFGPNGEIIKAGQTIVNDLTRGPGEHNDIVGRKGWLRQRLGF